MLIEKRITSGVAVRELCIKHNYYTRGDIMRYSRLLAFADDCGAAGTTAVDIEAIAYDIFEHSDVDSICEEYGATPAEALCNIAYNLCREAIYSVFEEV